MASDTEPEGYYGGQTHITVTPRGPTASEKTSLWNLLQSPEGRDRVMNAISQQPERIAAGIADMFKYPGQIYSGEKQLPPSFDPAEDDPRADEAIEKSFALASFSNNGPIMLGSSPAFTAHEFLERTREKSRDLMGERPSEGAAEHSFGPVGSVDNDVSSEFTARLASREADASLDSLFQRVSFNQDQGREETPQPAPNPTWRDVAANIVNNLFGLNGHPRQQLWPERMIRSGATLAHDSMTGEEPNTMGLRREDFTDIPPAESGGEGGIAQMLGFNPRPVTASPQDSLIERTQDMAGLMLGGGLTLGVEKNSLAAIGRRGARPAAGGQVVQPSAQLEPSSASGRLSLFARSGETGRASTNSSGVAPPSTQEPLTQVSTRPEPSGSSTTRPTTPSPTTAGPRTTFGDFELGAIDPASGKYVLQGTNDVNALLERAQVNRPLLVNELKLLTSDIDGASFVGARVKDSAGMAAKIQANGRSPSTVSDFLGGRVSVETPEALNKVLDRLEATGAVIEEDNFIHSPKSGYRGFHAQVELGDGTSAEIQVIPKALLDVFKEAHEIRQPLKRLDLSDPAQMAKFKEGIARSEKLFDDAWKNAGPGWKSFERTREVPIPDPAAQRAGAADMRAWSDKLAEFNGGNINAKIISEYGKPYEFNRESFKGSASTAHRCYELAAKAAMGDPSLTYVEGYVNVHGVPIEHAWTVDSRGMIHDPTLADGKGVQGYFGVPIDTDYLRDTLIKKKTYGIFQMDNRKIGDLDPNKFLATEAIKPEDYAPVFRSAVVDSVAAAPFKKAIVSDWLGWLRNQKGVKQEELDWLGVEDWMKKQPKGTLTREDVLDYVRDNQVQLKDVIKHDDPESSIRADEIANTWIEHDGPVKMSIEDRPDGMVNIEDPYGNIVAVTSKEKAVGVRKQVESEIQDNLERQDADALFDMATIADDNNSRSSGGTKYGPESSYTGLNVPGGENYREILLALPAKRDFNDVQLEFEALNPRLKRYSPEYDDLLEKYEDEQAQKGGVGENFTGGHWDEPNVIAHARIDDRVIDGKSTLFIEEVQSDWHQQGRKKGYIEKFQETKAEDLVDPVQVTEASTPQDVPKWNFKNKLTGATEFGWGRTVEEARGDALRWANSDARRSLRPGYDMGVPDAPFKKTWPEVVLKRMIRLAAEEGKDQIAWTSGDIQVDRNKLGRRVSEIGFVKNDDGTFDVQGVPVNSHGTVPIAKNVHPDVLDQYVGKGMSKKVIADVVNPSSEWKIYRGVDLNVGGKGMKTFYDKELVNVANSLGKKFGAKVQKAEINTGAEDAVSGDMVMNYFRSEMNLPTDRNKTEFWQKLTQEQRNNWVERYRKEKVDSVHVLPITPRMKRAAVSEGFPLFATGAPVPAPSSQSQEPPQKAVDALRDGPHLAPEFDKKYGEGSSQRYLQ